MKKSKLLFPILSCLTLLSTSVFGYVGSDDYSGDYNSNEYPSGEYSSKQYNPGQGKCVGPNCSSMDLVVFEEEDEVQTYKEHGFSRGDMRNLFSYKYDPKTEGTFSGTVSKVMRVRFPDENSYLIAVLRTDNGQHYLVNLGPVWYADENNFEVNEGDTLTIKGSKIKTKGRFIIIAAEAKKDDQTLILRNRSGSPQWGTPKAQKGGENHYRPNMMNRQPQENYSYSNQGSY